MATVLCVLQGSSDEHTDLVVEHKCLSMLEASHKCAVAQLQWLPGWEVTGRGALLTGVEARGACNFFATCAADGRVFFWDWRMDLQRSKRRKADGAVPQRGPLAAVGGRCMCVRLPGTFTANRFDHSEATSAERRARNASAPAGFLVCMGRHRSLQVASSVCSKQVSATRYPLS